MKYYLFFRQKRTCLRLESTMIPSTISTRSVQVRELFEVSPAGGENLPRSSLL